MGTIKTNQTTSAELGNRLFFRLFQCANMMHKTGTRAVEEHGATTQQWAVLGALSRETANSGMTVGELAEFLLVSRQNLTGVLSRLEKHGYTERTRDSVDGRSRRIQLTPEGRALWEKRLLPEIFEYYEDVLQGLSDDDQASILHLLGKLLDNLKAFDEKTSSR
ncbi:MAG: MarR family transcriptional regulator [Rhodospirillaceae bacterium]|nr:MarR family transcriptional regulator [Rhodospirillaceae bacterium]